MGDIWYDVLGEANSHGVMGGVYMDGWCVHGLSIYSPQHVDM